jgi:hypothetical protein
MKRWMPLLLLLVAAVLPVSCRRSSNGTSSTQENGLEEHFHDQMLVALGARKGEMTFAWRKPKPIGDPCPNTSGSPSDVARRYRGQKCSIVVVYPNTSIGYVFFVNWKVVGIDNGAGGDKAGPSPSPREVIQTIITKYGSKYVVSK